MKTIFPTIAFLLLTNAISHAQGNIVSSRYAEYPFALPNTVFKLEKELDPNTGAIRLKKSGIAISASELIALESQEQSAKSARLGRLSEVLYSKVSGMGASEKKKILIYAKFPPITYPDKTVASREEQIAASIAAANLPPMVGLSEIADEYGLSTVEYFGSSKALFEATKDQINSLRSSNAIAVVEEFNQDGPASVELATLAPSAYNPGPIPSGSGSGIHAATFEWGLTSTLLSCLGVSATYDVSTTLDGGNIRHTQAAFRSLVSTAPSASFYHRSTSYFDGSSDINYLINNAIQTVSMSNARGSTAPYHSTYAEFLVMDDFAYRYPYPVFVNPSYNDGYQYEVNWQGYNGISVGNVRHTNNSTYEMADCTQAKNPPPVYGSCLSGSGSNCAGDREMPYVLVPGIPSSGTTFATTCLEGIASVSCGTSWSAPVGNGIAANILAADSRMTDWPEKVRAIMVLTAQNVDGGEWASNTTDGRDGAGVVSGSEAVSFAQNHTFVNLNSTAVEKGINTASLNSTHFNGTSRRVNYLVPNPKPSGKHLRVVLTWDSNPVVGGGVNALSDLDLTVQTGTGSQASASWDGNVEVVDVAAANVTAGSSYYIDVVPVINRIPTSGSRTTHFYYVVAWTWVKDHAP